MDGDARVGAHRCERCCPVCGVVNLVVYKQAACRLYFQDVETFDQGVAVARGTLMLHIAQQDGAAIGNVAYIDGNYVAGFHIDARRVAVRRERIAHFNQTSPSAFLADRLITANAESLLVVAPTVLIGSPIAVLHLACHVDDCLRNAVSRHCAGEGVV